MIRRVWPLGLLLMIAAGGCLPEDAGLATVSAGFRDATPRAAVQTQNVYHAPASEEAAKRVLQVGGQVLVANPQLAVRPTFTTIGAPTEEIFHSADKIVFITEGLVRECRTDGQLAAVLCHELGKMAAERQEMAGPPPDHGPPMEVPIGPDYANALGSPDRTHAMELAVYEHKRQAAAARRRRPPTPTRWRAPSSRRPAAAPPTSTPRRRCCAAEGHMDFEKQMAGPK